MNHLRLDGKYTDVTIKCGGRTFECHRVVLAAMSEFFECMFDVEMQVSIGILLMITGKIMHCSASGSKTRGQVVYIMK